MKIHNNNNSPKRRDLGDAPCSLFEFFVWVTPRITEGIAGDDSEVGMNNSCLLAMREGYEEWAREKRIPIDDAPTFEELWGQLRISQGYNE